MQTSPSTATSRLPPPSPKDSGRERLPSMHILMLSWEYPPHMVGGIGTHVAALVPALAERGVQVTIITPRRGGGDPETKLNHNVTIYRVDPPATTAGDYYSDAQQTNLNLEKFANELWPPGETGKGKGNARFDMIHAHDWLVAFAADALKRLHRTPLVATIHATERGRGRGYLTNHTSHAINRVEWSLAYEAWRVITASRFMAEEVQSYFQLPPDKIDVIPNGVDPAGFDLLDGVDLSDFRARWARPDEKIVLFVGRMQSEKGPQVLVEAASRVLSEVPRAQFILAGRGAVVDALRVRALDLGIADRLQVIGFVPDQDRDKLYKIADVAVFPSLYEPFGIVALEAMAAKCPVVVSNVGGLKEVVKDNETGIVVHPDSVDSLSWGILHTLHHPDWAALRAANAYREVCKVYSWGPIAEQTLEVYDRVLRERARVPWV
jgi:glycogen(starch) synthase